MNKTLLLSFCFLAACSPNTTQVKQLGPLLKPGASPAICKIVGVLPDSPARKAGLQAGETIQRVNGTQPADAVAVSDLVDKAGDAAALEVVDAAGKTRNVNVPLNKEKPRLGLSCDLTGWTKTSVSAAGNEAITLFQGPYALTVSGIFDKGVAFMRVRIGNYSEQPVVVSPALFSIQDGGQAPISVLTPEEVMYFMHGEDAVAYIKRPADGSPGARKWLPVPPISVVRNATPSRKKKDDWSRSDEQFVQANATYLNKESLWATTVAPGKYADGLIYFLEPKALPVTIQAKLEGYEWSVPFGPPQPSTQQMSIDDLEKFFEVQPKRTALRLTLKSGKVFVGRYNSYDAINEIVWFDTPSGILLTTSSFGLKHIAFAEVLTPEQTLQQPAAAPSK